MNKKMKKILGITLIVLVAISILFITTTVVNAGPLDIPSASDSSAIPWIQGWGGKILGIFQAVGVSVAVVMLAWLGIKYIMASPDGKAEIKKQAFAYILGAILLFGAAVIVEVVKNAATPEEQTGHIQTIETVYKA